MFCVLRSALQGPTFACPKLHENPWTGLGLRYWAETPSNSSHQPRLSSCESMGRWSPICLRHRAWTTRRGLLVQLNLSCSCLWTGICLALADPHVWGEGADSKFRVRPLQDYERSLALHLFFLGLRAGNLGRPECFKTFLAACSFQCIT